MSELLLIIDGNALLHRAYHAVPRFMTAPNGTIVNAVYGFASTVNKLISDYNPSHILVCFDSPGPTFRNELFKDYRAQRPEADKELVNQFDLTYEFLDSASIRHIQQSGMEADDIIGAFTKKVNKENIRIIIFTGDKDIFQLIEKNTFVLFPKKNTTNEILYDKEKVKKLFGVEPCYIPDFKALAGDSSDNYKGVPGIGPKTAADLINRFGDIENIYYHINEIKNNRLKKILTEGKKQAMISKKLALLNTNIDLSISLKDIKFYGYDIKLKDFFKKYRFKTLYKRFFKEKEDLQEKINEEKKESQIRLF